jgi:hypothetical protein
VQRVTYATKTNNNRNSIVAEIDRVRARNGAAQGIPNIVTTRVYSSDTAATMNYSRGRERKVKQ